jgi:hypothetical protein
MIKPLSTAKLQSVREIKKKAKVKKINKTVTTIVIIILLLVIIFFSLKTFVFPFFLNQEYTETEYGVTFVSKEYNVVDSIKILEQDKNISVLYNVPYENQEYMYDIPDLFYIYPSVFSAKQKNVTIIVGLLDSKNNLVGCTTNFGDKNINEDINAEACQSLIQKNNLLVNIKYPNSEETKVYLSVDEKLITIHAKNIQELHIATYVLLKSMYEEFEDIMQKIRDFKIDQNIQTI